MEQVKKSNVLKTKDCESKKINELSLKNTSLCQNYLDQIGTCKSSSMNEMNEADECVNDLLLRGTKSVRSRSEGDK